MLTPSQQISPATGNVTHSPQNVPASAPIAVVSEILLEQLTLNSLVASGDTIQALRSLHRGLQQGSSPGSYLTPALSDGSQIMVDVSHAGQVTLSALVDGNTTRSVTVTPTHPAWRNISAIPEHTCLLAEWKAWADEPTSEQENRAQAMENLVECLFSAGTELKINGLELSSLPLHLPPGLTLLDISENQLPLLPKLPVTLTRLNAAFNQLTSLPVFPDGLQQLAVSHNLLTTLPELPQDLKILDASHNQLTMLPTLAAGLIDLDVSYNQLYQTPLLPAGLTSLSANNNRFGNLGNLPPALTRLNASNNLLTTLGALPVNLKGLFVENNQLTRLPDLPVGLTALDASYNPLNLLPALPPALSELVCDNCHLQTLPPLPNGMKILHVENNYLEVLPELPLELDSLNANHNSLMILPALPGKLTLLTVENNPLVTLPTLPETLTHLRASNNQLIILPRLPNNLILVDVSNNQLIVLPELGRSINTLDVSNNLLTALPVLPGRINLIVAGNNRLTALPVLPDGLKMLFVENNRLITLPRLPGSLKALYAENNHLTTLPELSEELEVLDVSFNYLAHLPVPHPGLWMESGGNPVVFRPSDMITCWFPRQQHRTLHAAWTPLLEEANGVAFVRFLIRLAQSISARDPAFCEHVAAWLNELTVTPELRERTFGVALEASESCTDRAALGWNSMQTVRLLYHAMHRSGGTPPTEFQTLAHQIFRIQRIEAHAADVVRRMDEGTDAVEVYLNYFCHLKIRLGLPEIFAENMDFPSLHRITADEVNFAAEMIMTDEERNFRAWFYDWDPLQQYLQKDMTEDEREALSDRRLDVYETQLDRLKTENQQILGEAGVLTQLGLRATTLTNEIIFGPLAQARFNAPEAGGV